MDIWFFVNDWYMWTIMYIVGWIINCRVALAQGWNIDYHGNLEWKDTYGDAYKWQAYAGSWLWPLVLPCVLAYKSHNNGTPGLFAGRPPKEMRKEIKEKTAQKELERVNKILEEAGIET